MLNSRIPASALSADSMLFSDT